MRVGGGCDAAVVWRCIVVACGGRCSGDEEVMQDESDIVVNLNYIFPKCKVHSFILK